MAVSFLRAPLCRLQPIMNKLGPFSADVWPAGFGRLRPKPGQFWTNLADRSSPNMEPTFADILTTSVDVGPLRPKFGGNRPQLGPHRGEIGRVGSPALAKTARPTRRTIHRSTDPPTHRHTSRPTNRRTAWPLDPIDRSTDRCLRPYTWTPCIHPLGRT